MASRICAAEKGISRRSRPGPPDDVARVEGRCRVPAASLVYGDRLAEVGWLHRAAVDPALARRPSPGGHSLRAASDGDVAGLADRHRRRPLASRPWARAPGGCRLDAGLLPAAGWLGRARRLHAPPEGKRP